MTTKCMRNNDSKDGICRMYRYLRVQHKGWDSTKLMSKRNKVHLPTGLSSFPFPMLPKCALEDLEDWGETQTRFRGRATAVKEVGEGEVPLRGQTTLN